MRAFPSLGVAGAQQQNINKTTWHFPESASIGGALIMKLFQLLLALPAFAAAAHIGVVGPVALHRDHRARPGSLALAIPGDSVAEALLIDGSLNFLSVYGGIITLRILLSWVPQAQSVALLRPVFTVSDVYLNLFRGVIPAIGGLDLSPSACRVVGRCMYWLPATAAGAHPCLRPFTPSPRHHVHSCRLFRVEPPHQLGGVPGRAQRAVAATCRHRWPSAQGMGEAAHCMNALSPPCVLYAVSRRDHARGHMPVFCPHSGALCCM